MRRLTKKSLYPADARDTKPSDAVFILSPEDRSRLSKGLLASLAKLSDMFQGQGQGPEARELRALFTALQDNDDDLKAARVSTPAPANVSTPRGLRSA
jgi:hypothetical protein